MICYDYDDDPAIIMNLTTTSLTHLGRSEPDHRLEFDLVGLHGAGFRSLKV